MFFKKKRILVTHNGSFHSDDVFACATLQLALEKKGESYQVIRTRDEEIIKTGDYVFDVGGVYDPETNHFDHHQKGGAGERENGVPYAAFGLVWKHFGKELCGSKKVAETLDKKLVQPIDAWDNGFPITKSLITDIEPATINGVIEKFGPVWNEEQKFDRPFSGVVKIAREILEVLIKREQAKELARGRVEGVYQDTEDKRLIVLDRFMPWQEFMRQYPEPLYVVFPTNDNKWGVQTVQEEGFVNRKDFPKEWAGLHGDEMAKISGVSDAGFCHNKLFFCVAESKQGALELAKLALDA